MDTVRSTFICKLEKVKAYIIDKDEWVHRTCKLFSRERRVLKRDEEGVWADHRTHLGDAASIFHSLPAQEVSVATGNFECEAMDKRNTRY